MSVPENLGCLACSSRNSLRVGIQCVPRLLWTVAAVWMHASHGWAGILQVYYVWNMGGLFEYIGAIPIVLLGISINGYINQQLSLSTECRVHGDKKAMKRMLCISQTH